MTDDTTSTANSAVTLSTDSAPTLELTRSEVQTPTLVNPAEQTQDNLQMQELTPAEQKMVADFAKQIESGSPVGARFVQGAAGVIPVFLAFQVVAEKGQVAQAQHHADGGRYI